MQGGDALLSVFRWSASVGLIAGGVAALADLAEPFAELRGYVLIAGIVLFCGALAYLLAAPSQHRFSVPLMAFAVIASAMSAYFIWLDPNPVDATGALQDRLGAMLQYERTTAEGVTTLVDQGEELRKDARETTVNTGQTSSNTQALLRFFQTSGGQTLPPAEQLAADKYKPNVQGLRAAILKGDFNSVGRFLQTGVRLSQADFEEILGERSLTDESARQLYSLWRERMVGFDGAEKLKYDLQNAVAAVKKNGLNWLYEQSCGETAARGIEQWVANYFARSCGDEGGWLTTTFNRYLITGEVPPIDGYRPVAATFLSNVSEMPPPGLYRVKGVTSFDPDWQTWAAQAGALGQAFLTELDGWPSFVPKACQRKRCEGDLFFWVGGEGVAALINADLHA